MASETPGRVRMWSFGQAPPEFQTLFPEGRHSDWVVHVPESERHELEFPLLQWRPVYPVRSTELADRSVVYFGAPREALKLIAERGERITTPLPPDQERRAAVRVPIECPSRYQTPKQAGSGYTIDMSSTGIAFTTETLLTRDAHVTLRVTWPVRLEGDVPVEFHAAGKLARSEPMKAAMQMDSMSFSIGR